MMHGREKSGLAIVAMKPANKAKKVHCGGGRSQLWTCSRLRQCMGSAKPGIDHPGSHAQLSPAAEMRLHELMAGSCHLRTHALQQ
jgi:hypothetical protein